MVEIKYETHTTVSSIANIGFFFNIMPTKYSFTYLDYYGKRGWFAEYKVTIRGGLIQSI